MISKVILPVYERPSMEQREEHIRWNESGVANAAQFRCAGHTIGERRFFAASEADTVDLRSSLELTLTLMNMKLRATVQPE